MNKLNDLLTIIFKLVLIVAIVFLTFVFYQISLNGRYDTSHKGYFIIDTRTGMTYELISKDGKLVKLKPEN